MRRLPIEKRFTGFTLIELLLVVSILSSVAYLAIDNIAFSDAQNKWELTEIRLQSMRRAILGSSDRVHNGRSELSGFVVDIGRPPECVSELLVAKDCSGADLPEYALFDHQQAGGWNGPYVNATHLTNGAAFRDAWGNESNSEDDIYFGWDYKYVDSVLDENFGAVVVQSVGLDRGVDPVLQEEYEKLSVYERDYPPTLHTGGDYSTDPEPLILPNQYQQMVTQYNSLTLEYSGAIWVDLGVLDACENGNNEFNNGACNPITVSPFSEEVCLKIASIKDGALDPEALVSREAVTFTLDGTRQLLAFQFGDAGNAYLAKGRHVASLHWWDAGNCTDNTVDFNANFDLANDGSVNDDDVLKLPFVILPGQMLDVLEREG